MRNQFFLASALLALVAIAQAGQLNLAQRGLLTSDGIDLDTWCNPGSAVGCISCLSPDFCLECDDGYVLIDDACVECDNNCLECTSGDSGDCTKCAEGYGLLDDGTCDSCTDSAAGCLDCPGDVDVCTKCELGYKVVSGDCVELDVIGCIDGSVSAAANEATCTTCAPGFEKVTTANADDECAVCTDNEGSNSAPTDNADLQAFVDGDVICLACEEDNTPEWTICTEAADYYYVDSTTDDPAECLGDASAGCIACGECTDCATTDCTEAGPGLFWYIDSSSTPTNQIYLTNDQLHFTDDCTEYTDTTDKICYGDNVDCRSDGTDSYCVCAKDYTFDGAECIKTPVPPSSGAGIPLTLVIDGAKFSDYSTAAKKTYIQDAFVNILYSLSNVEFGNNCTGVLATLVEGDAQTRRRSMLVTEYNANINAIIFFKKAADAAAAEDTVASVTGFLADVEDAANVIGITVVAADVDVGDAFSYSSAFASIASLRSLMMAAAVLAAALF